MTLEQLILEYRTFSKSFIFCGLQPLGKDKFIWKNSFLSPYNTIHQNPFTCFDIVFVQLLDIEKTRNKFLEIKFVAKCYLIN